MSYIYCCQFPDCGMSIKKLSILWVEYRNANKQTTRWMTYREKLLCEDHSIKQEFIWKDYLAKHHGSNKHQLSFIRDINKKEDEQLSIQYRGNAKVVHYPITIWNKKHDKAPEKVFKQIIAQLLEQKIDGYLPKTELEDLIKQCMVEYTVKSIGRSPFSLTGEEVDKMLTKPPEYKTVHQVPKTTCPNCQKEMKENPDKEWCVKNHRRDYYCTTVNCPKFMRPDKA